MNKNIKDFFKKNGYLVIISSILLVGFLVRIIYLGEVPNALNVDEASIGYEAYSILNYGIDRNGKNFPVFLESWGSGQNALYAYMIIPFIKIFGLGTLSVRLPMAIAGCISLVVMYKLLEKTKNRKLIVTVLAFFAITPWHIMKSRFGLESNIFPDIMLWATYFLVTALQDEKMAKFYIGSALLGICGYAYGTSYFFLPIFFIMLIIILIKRKKISYKQAAISFGIVFLISLPIILMVLINSFGLSEIKIWKITIPKVESNRYETLTLLSSGNVLDTLLDNFISSMKIMIFQTDGLISNSIYPYGITYIFSLPITIVGLINCFKKRNEVNFVINIWFISAFLLTFFVEPNINRINILWIPLIYYTAIGIYEIIKNTKYLRWIIIAIYIVFFIKFEQAYFKTDFTENYTFYNGIENVIKYTDDIEAENIYFQYAFKEPYIYVLFYNQTNPNDFKDTVKYKNDIKGFDSVISFGKYKFYLPKTMDDDKNSAYVMKKEKEVDYDIDEDIWKKTYIDSFLVLERK